MLEAVEEESKGGKDEQAVAPMPRKSSEPPLGWNDEEPDISLESEEEELPDLAHLRLGTLEK